MGFSNDDDPYGAMFAAADAEQREKAAASDKEWAARGVVKVAPEPEEEKEPSAISASHVGAFTSIRLVSIARCRGWFLFC